MFSKSVGSVWSLSLPVYSKECWQFLILQQRTPVRRTAPALPIVRRTTRSSTQPPHCLCCRQAGCPCSLYLFVAPINFRPLSSSAFSFSGLSGRICWPPTVTLRLRIIWAEAIMWYCTVCTCRLSAVTLYCSSVLLRARFDLEKKRRFGCLVVGWGWRGPNLPTTIARLCDVILGRLI